MKWHSFCRAITGPVPQTQSGWEVLGDGLAPCETRKRPSEGRLPAATALVPFIQADHKRLSGSLGSAASTFPETDPIRLGILHVVTEEVMDLMGNRLQY
ncbi:unnamed protein product [Boreogadus saida]